MPLGKVGVGGYTRKSKTGKTVHVSSYTQKRDLAAEMNALGRSQVAAQPGQMPGGRSIPLSPGVGPEQLKLQKSRVTALRKQVNAMRKQNPEMAAQIESTRAKLGKTVSAQKEKAAKKADAQKKISDAEKTTKTRGVDTAKLKEATDTLAKAAQIEKNRKAAAEKAKASKAAKAAEEAKAKEPTKDEKAALEDYMWEGSNLYKDLNRFLRKGTHEDNNKWTTETLQAKQAQLDSYMKKSTLPADTTVFRGIDSDVLFADGEPPMPGTLIRDDGFVSTSTSLKEAGWFGDVMLHMQLPKGFNAIDTQSDEAEVLLPRGTQFKVTEIKDNGDTIMVEPILPDYLQEAQNGGQDTQSGQPQATDTQASGQAQGQVPEQGVQGANDVGSGGLASNPPKPALTPEDLKTLQAPLSGGDVEASKAVLQHVFEGNFAGFDVTLDGDPQAAYGLELSQRLSISKDGQQVGWANRTFKRDTVMNLGMVLSPEVQGQGFAHAWNKAAEEQYRNMGVSSASIETAEVGGYAWARAGYDWDLEGKYNTDEDIYSSLHGILDRISSESEQLLDTDILYYEMVQDQIDELRARVDKFDGTDAEDLPTPFDFSQIGYQPGDTNWPGKTGMIGSKWYGVKKL